MSFGNPQLSNGAPTVNPFGGMSPFLSMGAPPTVNFGFGALPSPFGGIAQMAAPFIASMLGSHGMTMGNFMGAQNMADMQRALAYQREMQLASSAAGAATQEQLFRIMRGAAIMSYEDGRVPPEVTEHIKTLSQQIGPYAGFAVSMMDMLMPGISDSLGLGSQAAAARLFATSRGVVDPMTGRLGLSGAYTGGVINRLDEMLAGSESLHRSMQGYGIGAISSFYDLSRRAGVGTSMAADVLSREAIAALQAGVDPAIALSERERSRLSSSEIETLRRGIDDLDSAIQSIDAARMANIGKNMAGMMRAMEDIFGPGRPAEQMIAMAHSLTQGGLSRMSLSKMEDVVRQMKAGAEVAGVDINTMALWQVEAANAAAATGGTREVGVNAGLATAGFVAAAKARQGLNVTGVTLPELGVLDAKLRAQGATSAVGMQLATTVRLGRSGAFEAGSEAEAVYQAIVRGDATYRDPATGEIKSTYMEEDQWMQVMQGGSSYDRAALAAARNDRDINMVYAADSKVSSVVRRQQFDVQFRDTMRSMISGISGVGDDMADRLIDEEILGFVADDNMSQAEAFEAMQKNVAARLRAAGVENPEEKAMVIVSRANRMAATAVRDPSGKRGNIMLWGALFGQNVAEGDKMMPRVEARARISEIMSPLGRGGPLKRVIDTLTSAKPGEPLTMKDLFKAVANVQDTTDGPVAEAWAEIQSLMKEIDVLSGQPVTPEQKKKLEVKYAELEEQVANVQALQSKEPTVEPTAVGVPIQPKTAPGQPPEQPHVQPPGTSRMFVKSDTAAAGRDDAQDREMIVTIKSGKLKVDDDGDMILTGVGTGNWV